MQKDADRRRRDQPSNTSILARVLNTPHLAQIVPRLAPEVLHHLIRDHGLEACSGLIAVSTPQQLASVLDLDLWQTSPTRDDQFDERRFGTWLEALMNEGEAVAVQVIAAMDQDLAVTGLSRYVRVFDPGVFQPTAASDDELPDLDVARSTSLESEIGGYVVRARTSETWDAIVGLLAALADDRPDVFHGVMDGCRRVSNSTPEIDGLDDLLPDPEQLLRDVSIEREHRRTKQGYLAAGDARAFLQMARQRRSAGAGGSSSINGIAAAYFRELDTDLAPSGQSSPPADHHERSANDPEVAKSLDAVIDLLTRSGITSAQPRALLGPVGGDIARVIPLEPLLEYVHDTNEEVYFERNREFAFLANALVAGCSVYSRPLTAQEAWNAVAGICNIGLEVHSTTLPDDFLVNHEVLSAFETGWRLLHNDVSMFVTRHLIAILQELQTIDSPGQEDLYRLRRQLERHCDAETPWLSQDALEAIAIIDMPAWASLCGLLSECPVLPATMIAILDRRAGSVSATAFECFTTRDQIRKVHEFAVKLRDILIS
jgi:uncharacterized protein DUF6178